MDLSTLGGHSEQYQLSHAEIELVISAIELCCGQSFKDYSPKSMRRLIENLTYDERLRHPSELIPKLFHDPDFSASVIDKLTVSYSELFRDPHLFLQLKDNIFAQLASYPRFSIWVAGCATGEEVYSLAILLEEAGLLDKGQIYASDISRLALQSAASGKLKFRLTNQDEIRYQASGGTQSIYDYFSVEDETNQLPRLHPRLLSKVIFQHHDLVSQPSFVSAQLVLCRNVFIYFNRDLQEQVLSLLLDSMTSRSYLAIGTEENINFCKASSALEIISRRAGLFRKRSLLKDLAENDSA